MTDPTTHPDPEMVSEGLEYFWLAGDGGERLYVEAIRSMLDRQQAALAAKDEALAEAAAEIARLRATLRYAEAALADIGDAEREPGDDLAWCEQRAAEALPTVRAAIAARTPEGAGHG